jgi:hypothetical protein
MECMVSAWTSYMRIVAGIGLKRSRTSADKTIRRPFVQSSRAWVGSMVLGRQSDNH